MGFVFVLAAALPAASTPAENDRIDPKGQTFDPVAPEETVNG
jgi:hypothetical protein